MALRSDIPLLAQTNVNLSGAAEGFGQGVQIRTMLDKLNAERELKPIRKQLLETQAQQAQQTVSANDIKLAEAEEERQLLSMATGAMEVLPFLTGDSIDIQSAVDVVDQRSQRLLSEGRADVSDTAAVADALESGDPQRIQQVVKQMQSIVDIAGARGLVERPPGQTGAIKVQSSKINPDGSATVVSANGDVSVIQPSDEEKAALKAANQYGVELKLQEAGGKVQTKELAKLRSEIKKQYVSTLRSAPVEIAKLTQVQELFDKADTGTGQAFLAAAGKLLPGATPPNLEAAIAASGEFVLNALSRIKGPITEKELAFISSIAPQIRNSPEGNRMIIGRAIKAYQDELELAKAQKAFDGNIEDFDVEAFVAEREGIRNAEFPLIEPPSNDGLSELDKILAQ
jgi:DNA polymerase III gamma/tau subunit